jgi:hypothetical protein
MHRQVSFRISTVCALTGLGRTTVYSAIKAGDLIARKYGRCTVVLEHDLNDFLGNLPSATAPTLNTVKRAWSRVRSTSGIRRNANPPKTADEAS